MVDEAQSRPRRPPPTPNLAGPPIASTSYLETPARRQALLRNPSTRASACSDQRQASLWGVGAVLPGERRAQQARGQLERLQSSNRDAVTSPTLARASTSPKGLEMVAGITRCDSPGSLDNVTSPTLMRGESDDIAVARSPGIIEDEDSRSERTSQTARSNDGAPQPDDGAASGAAGGQVGGELPRTTDDWKDVAGQQDDLDLPVSNYWSRVRFVLREPLAEFLGTIVLIVIGVGSNCQVHLSGDAQGDFSSMNWAWGFAVMSSIYIAGGISGGHINPAITITLAVFRGFPWAMVPRYILAQVSGAFCGALIIYGNYTRGLNLYDPDKLVRATDANSNPSAGLFVTVPDELLWGARQGVAQEVLASAVLVIVVLALGDEHNAPPGAGLGALVLGLVITAIGMSMGMISGYAINPSRDLGPRLALSAVGYGRKLWTHDSWWWLIGPICGPLIGGILGAFVYDLLIFTGDGRLVSSCFFLNEDRPEIDAWPSSPVNYTGRDLQRAFGITKVSNQWKRMANRVSPERRAADQAAALSDATSGAYTEAHARVLADLARERKEKKAEKHDEVDVPRRWRIGKEKRRREKLGKRKRVAKLMEEEEGRKRAEHDHSSSLP